MKDLNLRGNQIRDVSPLSGLINLETIFLYGNQITDTLPLSGLIKYHLKHADVFLREL